MHICIEVIDFTSDFFNFIVGFRSCSNSVNYIVCYFIILSVVINITIRLD